MADKKLIVADFETKSVVVSDDAIVITFVSDWTEKKKTLPFTDAGLKVKDWIKSIIESEDYRIDNIWKDIKEWGNLYWFVINLADKQKAINDAFAELKKQAGLSVDPIDAI